MPPTLSAVSASFVSPAAVLLALTLSRSATAEQGEPGLIDHDPAADLTPPPEYGELHPGGEIPESNMQAPAPLVKITSVGPALPPASLERMLGPALKSSFDLRFSLANDFKPEDLFRSRTGSLVRIHVWVDTRDYRRVRIYFANRDGTRYLVRDLERSGSLDEMDREAISQAVEWSLQALSQGTVGMTREEAEELLSEDHREHNAEASAERASPRRTSTWRRRADTWLAEVALLHRWTPFSGELMQTQGPMLRIGADRVGRGSQFGVSASLHYQHPQRYAGEGVELSLQTLGARVEGRALAIGLVSNSGFGPRFGMGLDIVSSSAVALDWARYEAAPRTQNLVPLIDAGFVWQIRAEANVRLEMSLGVEVDLIELRYDLIAAGEARPLVSRWPVRPAATIGVALF